MGAGPGHRGACGDGDGGPNHTIAVSRLRADPDTRAYAERRRDTLRRCFLRAIPGSTYRTG